MKKMNDPKQNNRLNVLSDRECKRLAKRAASMAIAAALASSVLCAPALAVNYNASLGTVFVEGMNGIIQSWQGGDKNSSEVSNETEINITGGTSNSDGVDTTDQILNVSGNVAGADINITDVTADLTGDNGDKNAIEVGDGASGTSGMGSGGASRGIEYSVVKRYLVVSISGLAGFDVDWALKRSSLHSVNGFVLTLWLAALRSASISLHS